MRIVGLISVVLVLAASGCNSQPQQTPAPPQPEFRPIVSVAELMGHSIEPNAFGIWDAIQTTITAKGTVEKVPRTEEEWELVRNHAVTLVESGNLLLIPGRRVTEPGVPSADPATELPPDQIEARVKQDPVLWASHVHNFIDVAELSLKAVDAKDPQP